MQLRRPKDVAARVAANTLAKRGPHYTDEVRRLLDAAFAVMGEHGTTARVRVADIVAREPACPTIPSTGTSPRRTHWWWPFSRTAPNASRATYEHQMGKEATPEGKVRRWVEGVMSQTREQAADTTLAVLWNGTSVGAGVTAGRYDASVPLGDLLVEPFAALGSATPEMDASLAAHATLGKVSDYLWTGTRPHRDDIERITEFCIDTAMPRPTTR